MPTLTDQQAAQVLYNAGFRGNQLATMVAIGHAESGLKYGFPDSLNAIAPDYSVSPWQINYYGGLKEGRTQKYGSPVDVANDPQKAANAAFDISGQGRNFNAWSTYTSGKYLEYLPAASIAASGITGGGAVGSVGSAPGVFGGAGSSDQGSATNKRILNIPVPIPGVPSIHVYESQGRALLGGICILAGGVIVIIGIARIVAPGVAGVTKNLPGPVGIASSVIAGSKDRKLEREIDKGSKVPQGGGASQEAIKESGFSSKGKFVGKSVNAKDLDYEPF